MINHSSSKKLLYLDVVRELRRKFLLHLPVCSSATTEKIIYNVLTSYMKNESLNVKVIFANLNTSPMGARYHFNKLIAEEWIILKKSLEDKRTRHVLPSKKLLTRLDILLFDLEKILIFNKTLRSQ